MKGRYFLASFFGALIGATCVLVAVHVTNASALVIEDHGIDAAISTLHTRINDFYIFAGIVITLLLAINVGVFIRADAEIDKHIKENVFIYRERIENIHAQCRRILSDLKKRSSNAKRKFK